MDWVATAKELFFSEKPQHFTNYKHCEECQEHDETLINSSIDTISLEELGNPAWEPICFCHNEGKKYYIPAFIRLSLASIDDEFYLGQFLFHLESNGKRNDLFLACNSQQRQFIAKFIAYMIDNFAEQIEKNHYTDRILTVYDIWSDEMID